LTRSGGSSPLVDSSLAADVITEYGCGWTQVPVGASHPPDVRVLPAHDNYLVDN
jgi:hypothetical protein